MQHLFFKFRGSVQACSSQAERKWNFKSKAYEDLASTFLLASRVIDINDFFAGQRAALKNVGCSQQRGWARPNMEI